MKPHNLKYLKQKARNLDKGLDASGRLPARPNTEIRRKVAQAVSNCDRMKAEATMRAMNWVRENSI